MTETEVPEIRVGVSRNTKRVVSLEIADTNAFPKWEQVDIQLAKLNTPRSEVNNHVARSVLRGAWPGLAEQVRELRGQVQSSSDLPDGAVVAGASTRIPSTGRRARRFSLRWRLRRTSR